MKVMGNRSGKTTHKKGQWYRMVDVKFGYEKPAESEWAEAVDDYSFESDEVPFRMSRTARVAARR